MGRSTYIYIHIYMCDCVCMYVYHKYVLHITCMCRWCKRKGVRSAADGNKHTSNSGHRYVLSALDKQIHAPHTHAPGLAGCRDEGRE